MKNMGEPLGIKRRVATMHYIVVRIALMQCTVATLCCCNVILRVLLTMGSFSQVLNRV